MIPYEIAWTPCCEEWKWTGTETVLDEKKKPNYSWAFYKYLDSELTDKTWETSLVTAVLATGEFVTPKTDICGTLTCWDSNAQWRKDSWRENKTAELTYWREVYRHRPKPGNAGTETDGDSNNAPDIGKNGVWHTERKIGNGSAEASQADCSLDSRTERPTSNYCVQKKRGNTHPG